MSLNWHEVIVPTERMSGEAHLAIYEYNDHENATLKIEDANRVSDRRAFKCVAYHKDNRYGVFDTRLLCRFARIYYHAACHSPIGPRARNLPSSCAFETATLLCGHSLGSWPRSSWFVS